VGTGTLACAGERSSPDPPGLKPEMKIACIPTAEAVGFHAL